MHSADAWQNAVYHQRQAILRNSSSAEEGIQQLVKLAWANKDKKGYRTTLLTAFMALLCIIAFTAAGGLSSRVSTAGETECLIQSRNCGFFDFSNGPILTDAHADGAGAIFTLKPTRAARIHTADSYAQQCYSNRTAGNVNCGPFVVKRLTSHIDTNAVCPFESGMCRSSSKNLRIDSGYIDSLEHLGINSVSDRYFARNVLHCAPITTEGYTSERSTPLGNITLYHYGTLLAPSGWQNFVFAARSIESQYQLALSTDYPVLGANYGLS